MFDYDEENSHCPHTLSLSVFHDGECRADLLASVSELVTPEDLLQLQLGQFFCSWMKMDRKKGDHIWQQIADKVGAPVPCHSEELLAVVMFVTSSDHIC